MSSRSTTWTITNATDSDFTLVSADLDHGVWADAPANIIPAGGVATFRAESNGFATGDEGTVTYKLPAGNYVFYFNNPFVGSDGFSVANPPGYDNRTSQSTGNDQVLNSRCFKVG